MRRTGPTQPPRKFQPVSVSRHSIQPLALSSRRVRSTDETSRCLRRHNTIRTRARPDHENVTRYRSSISRVRRHRRRSLPHLASCAEKTCLRLRIPFHHFVPICRSFESYKPSWNDRSISRLVAMHSSNSAANATPRTLTTTCRSPVSSTLTCSPGDVIKARKIL